LPLLKYRYYKRKSKFPYQPLSKWRREKLSFQEKLLRYKAIPQQRILYHLFYDLLHACARLVMKVDAIARSLLKKPQRGLRLKDQVRLWR